jgi:hypothetical protein
MHKFFPTASNLMSAFRVQFLEWYFIIFILVMFKDGCNTLGYVTTKLALLLSNELEGMWK